MDPNAARAKMIESANLVLGLGQRAEANTDTFTNVAIELAESVHDLDGWLRSGGFLPEEWSLSGTPYQPGRKQDVDIEVPRCNKLELHEIGGDIKPRPCPLDLGHQGGCAP